MAPRAFDRAGTPRETFSVPGSQYGDTRHAQHQGMPVSAPPSHSPAPSLPLSCFIVEDSPIIRQNLIATLEELLPMQVVGTAEDEQGALQWMRSPGASCDLMIIDIFLKAGTGLEVLRQAPALRPEARLVVLSNYATPDMRRRCVQLGAHRVFDKSAELEELLSYCATLADPTSDAEPEAS